MAKIVRMLLLPTKWHFNNVKTSYLTGLLTYKKSLGVTTKSVIWGAQFDVHGITYLAPKLADFLCPGTNFERDETGDLRGTSAAKTIWHNWLSRENKWNCYNVGFVWQTVYFHHALVPLMLSLDLEALAFKFVVLAFGSIWSDNLKEKKHNYLCQVYCHSTQYCVERKHSTVLKLHSYL